MKEQEFYTWLDSVGFDVIGTGGGCSAYSFGDYRGTRIVMSQNLNASVDMEMLQEAREEAERLDCLPDIDKSLCIGLSWPILKDGEYWDDDYAKNDTDHDGAVVTTLEDAIKHITFLMLKYSDVIVLPKETDK